MLKFDDSFSNSRVSELHTQEEERVIQSKAAQLGFDHVNLRGHPINPEAVAAIDERKAREVEVVGFELRRHDLFVAAKNPGDTKTQALFQELQTQRYTVHPYMCSSASLEFAWKRYADITDSSASKQGVFEINADDITRLSSTIKRTGDVVEILKKISSVSNIRRISETLELIFAGALALGASDIHIEPEESGVRLRYRFDGVLHDIVELDTYIFKRLLSRLKLLSEMVLNTRVEAQDGRFTFTAGDRNVEVRSSVIPGSSGESIVMRLLDPSVASFTMERVNLNPYLEQKLREQLKKPNGLIITTGPTGSGKTTALYAFLQEAHAEGVKIITIENPVEYKLKGIVQTQTSDDYTFASGLRAILRQDPDIIMIGEVRDREEAETAIHAAQTGHLVFTTLHTNSAVAGFARLIDLGIDPRVMGSSINIMIGQRLFRLLCNDCKVSYEASPREANMIKKVMSSHPHPIPVPEPLMIYQTGSCDICGGTGYKGRNGIHEAIIMDTAVEEAIINDPREHIILEAAKPQRIPTMTEDGIEKLLAGLTSIKELERVIELPFSDDDVAIEIQPPAKNIDGDDFLAHVV